MFSFALFCSIKQTVRAPVRARRGAFEESGFDEGNAFETQGAEEGFEPPCRGIFPEFGPGCGFYFAGVEHFFEESEVIVVVAGGEERGERDFGAWAGESEAEEVEFECGDAVFDEIFGDVRGVSGFHEEVFGFAEDVGLAVFGDVEFAGEGLRDDFGDGGGEGRGLSAVVEEVCY